MKGRTRGPSFFDMFTPTYELNNRILELVAEISENAALGGLDSEHHENLRLRKTNRIRCML